MDNIITNRLSIALCRYELRFNHTSENKQVTAIYNL